MFYYEASARASASEPACRCDDVRTGACIHRTDPTKLYCVVEESSCNDNAGAGA